MEPVSTLKDYLTHIHPFFAVSREREWIVIAGIIISLYFLTVLVRYALQTGIDS